MGLPLPIVVSVFTLVSCVLATKDNDNVVYVDPMQMQASMNINRRDATNEILQTIHQKLLQHTETLERMMAVVQHNEELTKSIIESLNEKLDEPETHGRIKIYRSNRRSNNDNEELPIVRYGKDIIKYGNLLKSVIMTDVARDPEVTVEDTDKPDSTKQSSEDTKIARKEIESKTTRYCVARYSKYKEKRPRINYKNTNIEGFERHPDYQSEWCVLAAQCNQNFKSICGFDSFYGLAIFNDICHMIEVNCYWNYIWLIPSSELIQAAFDDDEFAVAPC